MEGRCPLRALATRVAPHSISEVIAAIISDIGKSRRAHLFSRRLCELPRKTESQFDASEKIARGTRLAIRPNRNIGIGWRRARGLLASGAVQRKGSSQAGLQAGVTRRNRAAVLLKRYPFPTRTAAA